MKRAFRFIYEYLTICGLAMASSLVYIIFIFPNSFAPAGLGGVATMIQHSFGINAGYLSFLINLPLIVAVFIWVDKEFAVKTFVYILVFSSMLVLLQQAFRTFSRRNHQRSDTWLYLLCKLQLGRHRPDGGNNPQVFPLL